jgi:hypothetical protein
LLQGSNIINPVLISEQDTICPFSLTAEEMTEVENEVMKATTRKLAGGPDSRSTLAFPILISLVALLLLLLHEHI